MSARHALALVVVCLVAGCVTVAPPATPDGSSTTPFRPAETPSGQVDPDPVPVEVIEVVDGDTVDVALPDGTEETVRLVGVDTPEVYAENDPAEYEGVPATSAGEDCLREAGADATEYTAARLEAGNVSLAFDPEGDRRGGYGRLLAYVVVEGRNLNYDLVASGHARVYDTDFTLRGEFYEAQDRAQAETRGLWACRSPP